MVTVFIMTMLIVVSRPCQRAAAGLEGCEINGWGSILCVSEGNFSKDAEVAFTGCG